MQFLKETRIDFIGKRKFAFALSSILIVTSFALVGVKGLKYSIDFAGGSILQVRFPEPVPVDDIRHSLNAVGLGQSEIQRFGEANEMLVRIPEKGPTARADSVAKAVIKASFPDVEIRREETVGPKVGNELRSAAFQSIVLALFLLLLYVTFRFEFRFAVGAVLALAHDVIVAVGALVLIGHEISLVTIAALLTIVGFSLNDTIVVYDRIRENLRVPTREPLEAVLNRSINQVLARTIITSGTVLMSTLALLFFGGEVLWDFAYALTVGVVSGVYSTDFVAAPFVYEWDRRFPRKAKGTPSAPAAAAASKGKGSSAASSRKGAAAKAS